MMCSRFAKSCFQFPCRRFKQIRSVRIKNGVMYVAEDGATSHNWVRKVDYTTGERTR